MVLSRGVCPRTTVTYLRYLFSGSQPFSTPPLPTSTLGNNDFDPRARTPTPVAEIFVSPDLQQSGTSFKGLAPQTAFDWRHDFPAAAQADDCLWIAKGI